MEQGKEEGKEEETYENVKKEGFFKSLYAFLMHPFESIWKAVSYDYLSQQHTENINKLTQTYNEINNSKKEIEKLKEEISKQRDKMFQQGRETEIQKEEIFQQYNHINRLIKRGDYLFGRVCELVNRNENLEEQVEFFVNDVERNVEENPGYQNLEKERERYKKQVEDLKRLTDHLKDDKKRLIRFSHQIIDKIPATIMDYLRNDKHYSKLPLVFVNSSGLIVGYTLTLKEKLKIKDEFIGQNCYNLLANRYPDLSGLRAIRNFFNTLEEKSFDIDIKDGGKDIKLHLLKEEPVFLKDLDLRVLGKEKIVDTIAFIPIQVRPISKIIGIFHRDDSLDELIKKHGEEQKETYLGLITRHGWTQTMITAREKEIGYQYLKEEFLELEEGLKKRQESDEKKKAEDLFSILEGQGLGRDILDKLWHQSKNDIEKFKKLCAKKLEKLK